MFSLLIINNVKLLFYSITLILIFSSCKKDLPINRTTPYKTTPYEIITPTGFPDMIIPSDNPLTVEGIALGERLFNDPILSADSSLSCSGCHLKASAFSDER